MGFLSWPMLGDHMTYNNLHTLQIHVCKKHNICKVWGLGQSLHCLAREHESLAWGNPGQCLQFEKETVCSYHRFQGAVLNVSIIGLWFLKCVRLCLLLIWNVGSLTYNFLAYISLNVPFFHQQLRLWMWMWSRKYPAQPSPALLMMQPKVILNQSFSYHLSRKLRKTAEFITLKKGHHNWVTYLGTLGLQVFSVNVCRFSFGLFPGRLPKMHYKVSWTSNILNSENDFYCGEI